MKKDFMKKIVSLISVISLLLCLSVCTPVERQAYRTIVSAKAFLDSEKSQHPECATTPNTNICQLLKQATSAKDALIDAVNIYCASDSFDNGGPCTPPTKGTPAAQVATDKLKAAIASYNQIYLDIKGAI